ncbi:hypothetical protein [Streptomyces sp. NPDC000851]
MRKPGEGLLDRAVDAVVERGSVVLDRFTTHERDGVWGAVDVFIAVAIPVSVVGITYAGAMLNAHGPGWPSAVFGAVMILAGFSGGFFSFLLYLRSERWFIAQFLVMGLSSLLLCGVAAAVSGFVEDEVLQTRGRHTTCTVVEVDEQQHTTTHYDSAGNVTHTSTRTDYVHRLNCAAGRPDKFIMGVRWASPGSRLDVTYDPRGRVGAVPTELVGSEGESWPLVWAGVGVVITVRLGYVAVFFVAERRST